MSTLLNPLSERAIDIAAGRLPADAYPANFSDMHPPLGQHEAVVESDRCYFCYDAPCMNACPTSIDIPLFIRKIGTGNVDGAAETIFSSNILGGMCARVCPTEQLCEEACVREAAEGKPVRIGMLQRYATDHYMEDHATFGTRGEPTGKHVAVVGAGPAGLSAAHALARLGHDVDLLDAREKLGGLDEYGIASYKTVGGFAQTEVDFILSIGGITPKAGVKLGRDTSLADLRRDYDAVFLGLGLAGVNALGAEGEEMAGVSPAVDFIETLRQTTDLSTLPIGRRVVVIGGGMTAVDAAVQAKKLGAEDVTLVYRRGQPDMKASPYEQEVAQTAGVKLVFWAEPRRILGEGGHVAAVEFERVTPNAEGRLVGTGEPMLIPADQVFKAIGQLFIPGHLADGSAEPIALERGRIRVDEDGRTSAPGVWAGGDCVNRDEDLTVQAVEHGKVAARSIHAFLSAR
jgi:glutamate synthase (NADPH/NADH) small chain